MYCIVVQNQDCSVSQTIECDSLSQVQEVLEILEPNMDAQYLVSGEATNCTFGLFTYSFRKLEHALDIINQLA